MTIDRILSLIAIIVSFIAVPASGYLSYRYAVIGEKRKEFNSVADILRGKLRNQLKLVEAGIPPHGIPYGISEDEFDSLADHIGQRHLMKLRVEIAAYNQSLTTIVRERDFGDEKMTDPEAISKAIDRLMPFVERR